MRKQYHFRESPQGLRAWDIHRLVELSHDLVRERVPLSAIRELDEPYWANGSAQKLTCREIVNHARLMRDCDLTFPGHSFQRWSCDGRDASHLQGSFTRS